MSGILKRTVYYDNTGGLVRWTGYAMVITGIGAAVEPFEFSRHVPNTPVINFEHDDMITRVDEIQRVDIHRHWKQLSGGTDNPPLMGGHQVPRDGP